MTVDLRFKEVITNEQLESVIGLANIIWKEHYTPIIGADQVEYMLNEFHSYDAISKEIENKESLYYLILSDENIVGYAGIRLEKRVLFLSKLYILSSERGKGIGKSSIQFIIQIARSNHINLIYLTVNKENKKTIAAYKKIGFIITSEICADIGRGYYMDDYKMELEL